MENEGVRLNKYLSSTGLCSRREADKLIEEGHVTVEDAEGLMKTVTLGSRVREGDKIYVDGKPVRDKGEEKIYMIINKPKGIVCTGDRRVKENIIDYAGLNHYISYAGRLDRDSTGLVLLTNDGDLNDKIMRASGFHEKEYIVKVDRFITEDFLQRMSRGVEIVLDDDRHLSKEGDGEARGTRVMTRPCVIGQRSSRKFEIVLTQGYNRQIRRMCQALGYTALEIKRVRIMNLRLSGLKEGMKRFLTREEIEELRRLAEAPGKEPEGRVISAVKNYDGTGTLRRGHRPDGPGRTYGKGKPYGHRPEGGIEPYGERKPYGDRSEGDRKPYGERKPYAQRSEGERRSYGERKSYGEHSEGERRSYGERKSYGEHSEGERRSYGERKSYGDHSEGERRSYGERKAYGDRSEGERRPYGERKSYGGRSDGEKKPYGDRKAFGERSWRNDRGEWSDRGSRSYGGGEKRGSHFDNKGKAEAVRRKEEE